MTKAEAIQITGGLSHTEKMPGPSYNIPATKCLTGSKLHSVPGSICHKCYARKGRYGFPNVQNALMRRFDSLRDPQWVDAMALLISISCSETVPFRFHDSGDLQSQEHLASICRVCEKNPKVQHWLPTKEYKVVDSYIRGGGKIPDNLTIRLSALMLDGKAPTLHNLPTSSVSTKTKGVPPGAFACPAPSQGGQCKDCRACWKKEVAQVDYAYH